MLERQGISKTGERGRSEGSKEQKMFRRIGYTILKCIQIASKRRQNIDFSRRCKVPLFHIIRNERLHIHTFLSIPFSVTIRKILNKSVTLTHKGQHDIKIKLDFFKVIFPIYRRNKSRWHLLQLQLVDLAERSRDESAVTVSVPSFLIGQLQQCAR